MLSIRKEGKRKAAATLKAVRATRTPQQQLQELNKRLGEGVGAKKERARLMTPSTV